MKLKYLFAVVLMPILCSARAQAQQAQEMVDYNFTINPGYTVADAYLLTMEPGEIVAGVRPVAISPGQSFVAGQVSLFLPFYPYEYLTLLATFTDPSGNSGVAMSLPNGLAATLISDGTSWGGLSPAYTGGYNLPSAAQMTTELETGGGLISEQFAYMPANAEILNTPIESIAPGQFIFGTIVGFDGAEQVGSFSYSTPSLVPEPTTDLMFAAGLGMLACQWKRKLAPKPGLAI
jgi:hypothetical protein